MRGILAEYADQGLEGTIVQTGETDGRVQLILRMPYIEDAQVRNETIDEVKSRIEELYGFNDVDGDMGIIQEEQVGSEWGREVSTKALIALAVFVVIILIFITLRLEFKMGVAGIIALVHDTLITVGIYALTGRQVTPVTVIAFLTILGYSLYDTIVVFDRVEENANLMARTGRVSYRGDRQRERQPDPDALHRHHPHHPAPHHHHPHLRRRHPEGLRLRALPGRLPGGLLLRLPGLADPGRLEGEGAALRRRAREGRIQGGT